MYWGDLSKYRNQLYGLSILWIMIFHVYETFQSQLTFNWISSVIFLNGYIGVDLFLFLSGISMHYAMKKYDELNLKNIVNFYRRRIWKILKVYIVFCIPFLVVRDLIVGHDFSKFVKQLCFLDNHVSSFWYLFAIIICYLIYPFIEKCLRNEKKNIIIAILILYISSLFIMEKYIPGFFEAYEVLLTRIPIFVIGALYSSKVCKNDRVTLGEWSVLLLIILLKSPVVYGLSYIDAGVAAVVSRLLLGGIGVGVAFLALFLVKVYENTVIDSFIKKIGTFTLEIYVFHIAFRGVFLVALSYVGIEITEYHQIILFGIAYICISLIGSGILAGLIKRLRMRK